MIVPRRLSSFAAGTGAIVREATSGRNKIAALDACDDRIASMLRFTGSTLALSLLDHWETARGKFVKVFPHEYRRALSEQYLAQVKADKAVESWQKETV